MCDYRGINPKRIVLAMPTVFQLLPFRYALMNVQMTLQSHSRRDSPITHTRRRYAINQQQTTTQTPLRAALFTAARARIFTIFKRTKRKNLRQNVLSPTFRTSAVPFRSSSDSSAFLFWCCCCSDHSSTSTSRTQRPSTPIAQQNDGIPWTDGSRHERQQREQK